MCGIIGQLAFGELDEAKEKMRQESMIFLGSELLQLTQERGKDATGMSLLFDDGNYIGLKMGIPSIEFIARFGKNEKEYGGVVKAWRRTKKPVKVFLGHCRKTSRGSSLNNNNNHPIKVGEIIGVHNGTLENDDKIFSNLECKRNGQVDSEAIFRLLHHYTKNGAEPFTVEMVKEVVQRLDGTYAALAISGNNPYQVCAFRDRKPIDMALVRPLKLVIIASEKKFIETALFRYNKYGNLYMPDAKFPILRKGDIDYKILQDDSAVIFDLREKVSAKTEIGDLYDWEKMPRGIVDGYAKLTTSTTYNKKDSFNKAASGTTDKTTTTSSKANENKKTTDTKSTDKSDNKSTAGRVWSKKARRYMVGFDEEEMAKSKRTGNVEVNVMDGSVEELDDKDEDSSAPFELEHDKDAEGRILANAASIKELPAPKKEKDKKTETLKAEVTEDDGSTHTVEVDVMVDAEAVEKAEEMIKTEPMFDDIDEVLEALEIDNEETLRSIPITALVNRIKKFAMKAGFIRGFREQRDEERTDRKNKWAEKHIRSLKAILHMYEDILRFSGVGVRSGAIERAVIEAFEDGADLSKDNLDRIFTAGDERNSKILPLVKRIVADKEDR